MNSVESAFFLNLTVLMELMEKVVHPEISPVLWDLAVLKLWSSIRNPIPENPGDG